MATFTDDFNRADNETDLGANWTDCQGVGLGIVTNTAYSAVGGASRGSLVTGTTQTDNQYAQGTISETGSTRYISMFLRASGADGTLNGYVATAGGTNELEISEYTNGSSVPLTSTTFTLSNGMVLRGEANGTTIRLLIDGVEKLSTTDATYTTGKTGISIYNDTGSPRVDNFEAGDLGGGTVNTSTLTSSLSASDGTVSSAIRGNVSTDTLSLVDAVIAFYRRTREVTSNVDITDSPTDRLVNTNLEATSEIAVADDFVAWFRRTRLAQDDIQITDGLISSIIGYLIYTQILSSSIVVTDEALTTASFYRLVDSDIVTEDQLLRAVLVARDLLDSVEVSDSGLTAIQRFILLTDTISVEDSLLSTYVPYAQVNPLIRIGFDQPEVKLGGYSVN